MEVQISVRTLVEFMLRSGDIDNSHKASVSDTALSDGSRIHRMIQKRMGADYAAEVPLRYVYDAGEYSIIIDGRADGIITNERGVTIDEIKGTYRELSKIKTAYEIHIAQAKCYAAIYAIQNSLLDVCVRITYCNMETEELKYFFEDYTIMELTLWFEQLLGEYRKWADFEVKWKKIRKESAQKLQFPFPYREGQKELASDVYRTIYHHRKLFIEAPTGVGKTISTVFPAVKAIGEDKAEKIFYLTAKTITRTVASDTFAMLQDIGLRFKTVVITAKEKTCCCEEMNCNPRHCPRAKGHYDRINDAIYDMLTTIDTWNRDSIEAYAGKHQVCPFEMSLDMSLFADSVICDYNYLFDPHVYLRRFFAGDRTENYVFLVDEAHNLVDRGREMYSATICKEDLLQLRAKIKESYPENMRKGDFGKTVTALEKALNKANKDMLEVKHMCEEDYMVFHEHLFIEPCVLQLSRLLARMESYLEEDDEHPVREDVLNFYFELSHFLLMWEDIDDSYVSYAYYLPNGSFAIRLYCVNPAKKLKTCMDRGISSILFSATLLPIQYYKRLLGGDEKDYEVYAHSVFSKNQMGLYIANDVTTKYTDRNDLLYTRIAGQICAITEKKIGNYITFFPSHAFAQRVYKEFLKCKKEDTEAVLQTEYMGEEAREDFLGRFSNNTCFDFNGMFPMEVQMEEEQKGGLVAFCVMGGIFSEGIDLKGESLIGAIVVGNGLPQICMEREILRDYFDKNGESGFDFAYRYPGMNKVLQSAGRVIRTVNDFGVVVLLENRFLSPQYYRLFPREWENYCVVDEHTIASAVETFWNGVEKRQY